MGLLSDRTSTNKRRWNCKIEKQDTKDEFASLGYRALIVHFLLVASEKVAAAGCAGQSGQKN
jgi:hypothetical protein